MKLLIAGSRGFLGSAITERLQSAQHEVVRLVRGEAAPGQLSWDYEGGMVPDLRSFDAVVHLGGHPLASGRWSEKVKRLIKESRVHSAQALAAALNRSEPPPKVFICASAVGYYGDRGTAELTEQDSKGSGFLSDVCAAWEEAAREAAQRSRVVNLRFGVVLSARGGMIAKVRPLFRAGLGGRLGSGRQYMSWVSLADAVRAVEFCLQENEISGPVNVCSPQPVTNAAFTMTFAGALGRPAFLPAPAFALRTVFGELADAALLSSCRAVPAKLLSRGFSFSHPELRAQILL